ncbi:DMT family transporter [Enterobacillus tribolii]|uniref:Threonine/homoserine efflux transporter RhtA n=1 Tax=Enterobacillus tribolii TaxID=1487935 RepID=A0A370R196_9GAMM|nr:DMT family transporter [Enterobacillus tribolii]RDK95702.1 threonine/homoserine efflux transporter RhtA [Enterobacillus tribolii]
MMNIDVIRRRALWQMHGATVLFGISGIFGKLIASSASMLVFGRSAFALAAMSLLLLRLRRFPWQDLTVRGVVSLCACGALLCAHWVTFFIAVKVGGVAVGTLGFACFPAFVALLEGVLFREKLTGAEYLLIALVSIGLVLVTPDFSFDNRATEGLMWGVLSGLIYALLALANRRAAASINGGQVCWWQNLTVLVLLAPFCLRDVPAVSGIDWLWIACLGLLCTGLAYSLFINSLQVLKARVAAMIIALEPVYAILVAWVLFHETPSLRMVAGGALIIFAVCWTARRKS